MVRGYGFGRRFFNLAGLLGLVAILAFGSLAGAKPAVAADPPRLLLLGDSLFAGYGLPSGEGFASVLKNALAERGTEVTIIDGAVSGDTTAGGLARLDWLMAEKPTHAVVELGANDALRGLPPEQAYRNLDAIMEKLDEAGVEVLIAGMLAPPNLGTEYGDAFAGIYTRLAEKYDVPLYPFFLDGVALDPALNQPDRIHPNAKGVAVIVERILPHVETLLGGGRG